MRRIFHLLAHLRLGAGRYIVDLAVEQRRRGDSVAVCLSDDAEDNWKSDAGMVAELKAASVDVVRIGDTFHRDAATLREAAGRLKGYAASWSPADVVHAHTAMGGLVGRWAGALNVVCTCHGWSPVRPSEHDLQDAMAFSVCDGVASPSTYWSERVTRLAGIPGVRVMPYGFDLLRYPELPPPATSPRNTKRIVCLAELTARKGQDVLIAAMPLVWAAYPNTELHLIGDGDARRQLRAQARAVDPSGQFIVFRGFVERPYLTLREYDLLCLPTRSDNQPVAAGQKG